MQVARFAAESFPSSTTISLLLRRSAHSLFPSGSLSLQSSAAAAAAGADTSSGVETNGSSRSDRDGGKQQLRGEHGLAEGDLLSSGGGGGRGGDWQLCGRGDQRTKSGKRSFKGILGSDVLGNSTCVPQSSSSSARPHPSLQALHGFARGFSSGLSSAASKFVEPSDLHEYNNLISNISYQRRASLVRDVYDDMLLDGVQPNQETFLRLIDGCMKGSRLQDVMYFFEEMKAMGLTPDVALYNCVIAACGRSMQVDRAFQVAAEMEASGIQPKHRTFLALLRTCAIAGRIDEAYGVIRRMAASGLTLDKNFYTALIFAHKNKKPHTEEDIQKIFELLDQSKQQSAEDVMAVAATGELETYDDVDDGLASMLSNDIQPRRGFINRRLAVYHAAVKSFTALGNTEGVKTVLKLVQMDGHELDSYCVIQLINCHLAVHDFEQACAEYTSYVDTGRSPTLELYMVLIEGALDHWSPDSSAIAQKLLADLVQKGYFLNAQLGSQLLQKACQGKSRDIAVANVVWDMMMKREVRLSKFIVQEYYRALERNDTPKDDPRLIRVKTLVDEGKRFVIKGPVDPKRTTPLQATPSPSVDVSAQTVSSEQVDGHTASLEMPSDQDDLENKGPALVAEPPIEAPTNVESLTSSPENVASNEKE